MTGHWLGFQTLSHGKIVSNVMADDLLAIGCLSEDEETQGDQGDRRHGAAETTNSKPDQQARTKQTEEAFQAVKQQYQPKMENGEIWKSIKLPLGGKVSKPEAQEVLHAVEELYFFRRYAEGAAFVQELLSGESPSGLDDETRKTLALYRRKCLLKAGVPGEN